MADFGLCESIETREYFRQDKAAAIKLPVKWLAPESMEDYVFSEKSDVVSLINLFCQSLSKGVAYVFLVGIWCDLLGDFHWREGTLS